MKTSGCLHILIALVLLFFNNLVTAQDTSYVPEPEIYQQGIGTHNPNRAWQLSAVMPGLGQAYNKKYWKVPIVYLAGAAAYYYYTEKAKEYYMYRNAYISLNANGKISGKARTDLIAGISNLNEKNIDLVDQNTLYRRAFESQKEMERSIIIMFGVYVANVVDALVDGYFFNYDIKDDLVLRINPSMISVNNSLASSPALSFTFKF